MMCERIRIKIIKKKKVGGTWRCVMLLNDGVSDSGARVRVSRVSSYIDRHLFFFLGLLVFFSDASILLAAPG
jgi:hypothetical protein